MLASFNAESVSDLPAPSTSSAAYQLVDSGQAETEGSVAFFRAAAN
jgi:hypothetical protein